MSPLTVKRQNYGSGRNPKPVCLITTHFSQMLESWVNNVTVSFYWPLNISYILFWIKDHAPPSPPLERGTVISTTVSISVLYRWSHREVKAIAQGRQLGHGIPSPSAYISYCSRCCHKAPDKSNLRESSFWLTAAMGHTSW